MALNVVALNAAADAVADLVTAVSLHSASPGTTGANELSGGTYARLAPTYASAASSVADLASSLTFDVPSGATVAYYGLWAGTTFLDGNTVAASETYASDGTYELTSAPIDLS